MRGIKIMTLEEYDERHKFISISANIWPKTNKKLLDPKSKYYIGWDGQKTI